MRLRDSINLIARLNEAIVYRDRFIREPGLADARKTIVAINPTKQEWDQFFPKGAAGILLKNGRIVVGDGNMLPHHEILDHAKVPQNMEKYRLQLCRDGAWVELWLFNDDWTDAPSEDEVRAFAIKQYGETIEQIQAQLAAAIAPFMGNAPARCIPLGEDQDPLLPGDAEFIRMACASHY